MKIRELERIPGFVELRCDSDHFLRRKGETEITESQLATVPADKTDEWEEVDLAEAQAARAESDRQEKYKEDVVSRIRTRYSVDDENAILRKMLAVMLPEAAVLSESEKTPEEDRQVTHDPEAVIAEFREYDRYAEQCKAEALAFVDARPAEQCMSPDEDG